MPLRRCREGTKRSRRVIRAAFVGGVRRGRSHRPLAHRGYGAVAWLRGASTTRARSKTDGTCERRTSTVPGTSSGRTPADRMDARCCGSRFLVPRGLRAHALAQAVAFAGGIYDRDTALVHFGAREYDPMMRRWISKDPIGFMGSVHFYVCAGNGAIYLIDPTGLSIGRHDAGFDAMLVLTGKMLATLPKESRRRVSSGIDSHERAWHCSGLGGRTG